MIVRYHDPNYCTCQYEHERTGCENGHIGQTRVHLRKVQPIGIGVDNGRVPGCPAADGRGIAGSAEDGQGRHGQSLEAEAHGVRTRKHYLRRAHPDLSDIFISVPSTIVAVDNSLAVMTLE